MRISDWSSDVCSSDLARARCTVASAVWPVAPSSSRQSFISCRAGPWTSKARSEEHTSELQSLMRNSYAVFCLKNKKKSLHEQHTHHSNYMILLHQPT